MPSRHLQQRSWENWSSKAVPVCLHRPRAPLQGLCLPNFGGEKAHVVNYGHDHAVPFQPPYPDEALWGSAPVFVGVFAMSEYLVHQHAPLDHSLPMRVRCFCCDHVATGKGEAGNGPMHSCGGWSTPQRHVTCLQSSGCAGAHFITFDGGRQLRHVLYNDPLSPGVQRRQHRYPDCLQ